MQERHADRALYFKEQGLTTERYVIPYIREVKEIGPQSTILEVGCGEGGNLTPFLDLGCRVVGIDIMKDQIALARRYFSGHPNESNLTLIDQDIYQVHPGTLPAFNVIFLRDVIEHIPDQERFMHYIRSFMAPDGIIFFGFPPWRMPFGGHQQVCKSKFLSRLPWYHLLPNSLYTGLLKAFGESDELVKALLEVKETGISISRFHQCLAGAGWKIKKETYYLINPNYETKFGLKPKVLPAWLSIPWLCDYYTTAVYCIAGRD